MENELIYINKACEQIPQFNEYINIIKEQSTEPIKDLNDLELILRTHTTEQVFEFLPRFISLL